MIASLSIAQRRYGLALALCLALLGLLMAAAARQGPMAVHGAMALMLGVALTGALARTLNDPPPQNDRSSFYYDEPIRFGIAMTLIWALAGMAVGVWVAALLYWPDATPALPWTSFGRLRPVHTTGVIFGFGGNALIATSFYVLQRTSRARLADELSAWVVLIGFNLFCVWAVTGYLMGVTQSKDCDEDDLARRSLVCL